MILFFALSVFLSSVHSAHSFQFCGVYELSGMLKKNNQHQFILDINEGTREKTEILLLTKESENLLKNIGKNITTEVRFFKVDEKNESNIALLENFFSNKSVKKGVRLVKKLPCNN